MINVSVGKNHSCFQSIDDAMKFIQESAYERNEIWINGDKEYPSISVCTNENQMFMLFL